MAKKHHGADNGGFLRGKAEFTGRHNFDRFGNFDTSPGASPHEALDLNAISKMPAERFYSIFGKVEQIHLPAPKSERLYSLFCDKQALS